MVTEVKCEFTEFVDDSKKDSTAGTESKYHGSIIRSKEEKNRIVKKFRTLNSLEKVIKISQMI